jgi:hypothetical protein
MNLTSPSWRRHDTMAYGDRLRAERRRWQSPRFIAEQLVTALNHPSLPGDPNAVIGRAEAAREFGRLHPSAVQRLGGEAVVAAAVPEQSACRWCHATYFALIHRKPLPNPANFGVRLLLGEPCNHAGRMTPAERKQLMAKLNARIAPSRTAARRHQQAKLVEQQRALVASGGNRPFVIGDPASWRAWAREDVANRAPWVLDRRRGRFRTHSPKCICAGCRDV